MKHKNIIIEQQNAQGYRVCKILPFINKACIELCYLEGQNLAKAVAKQLDL